MEEFHMNNTSQNKSFSYSKITSNYNDYPDGQVIFVVVISAVGLFLTLMAICAVCCLVRKDHVGPIYVINLLILDLIQFCCLIPLVTGSYWTHPIILMLIFFICIDILMVSVCFMVCIALESYLLIACPLWCYFRHTIKFSVVLCVVIWVFSPVGYFMIMLLMSLGNIHIIIGTFFLLPLSLLIFFLCGTILTPSAGRVPADEKRRIVGTLVLVLLIYTLRFLPSIILFMAEFYHLLYMALLFVMLSPFADCFLYVVMRKGTIDKLLACCCRTDSNDISRMGSNDISSSIV